MPVSPAQRAKRALVQLLHALALLYRLSLALTCDAADAAVLRAFRKVALKAHPDKGGSTQHTTELLAAKKDWDAARAVAASAAAAAAAAAAVAAVVAAAAAPDFKQHIESHT